jgi:hypothetical protein
MNQEKDNGGIVYLSSNSGRWRFGGDDNMPNLKFQFKNEFPWMKDASFSREGSSHVGIIPQPHTSTRSFLFWLQSKRLHLLLNCVPIPGSIIELSATHHLHQSDLATLQKKSIQ